MHIPKLLLAVVCSTVVSAVSLHAQAVKPDTDAQAKARAALRGVDQSDTAPTAPMTNMAPVKPVAPPVQAPPVVVTPPAPAPKPVVVTPKPAPAPVMTMPATQPAPPAAVVIPPSQLTPEQEQKLRQAIRNMDQPVTPAPAIVTTPAPKPAPKSAPTPTVKPPQPPVTATVPPQPAPKPPVMATTPAPNPAPVLKPVVTAPPMTAPVTMAPAPGSKEARLNDLLEQYKADKITPAEYQAQRAKIRAEP